MPGSPWSLLIATLFKMNFYNGTKIWGYTFLFYLWLSSKLEMKILKEQLSFVLKEAAQRIINKVNVTRLVNGCEKK